jgi:hypothetical protein
MSLLPRWCVALLAVGLRLGDSFELGGGPARRPTEAEGTFIPRARRSDGRGGVPGASRVLSRTRRDTWWLSRQRMALLAGWLCFAEAGRSGVTP